MFRRKKEKKQAVGQDAMDIPALATNAPDHWPAIRRQLTGHDFIDQTAVFGALAGAGEHGPVKLRRIHHVRMFLDGFLTVPAEVEDAGRVRSVFIFADAQQAASRWAGIRALLRKAGEPEPVYYAPAPVPPAPAADPTRPFDYVLLSKVEPGPEGEFYMWWKTDDQGWAEARCRRLIRRYYEAVNSYESYHYAALLRGAGFIEEEAGRAKLPEEPVDLPVEVPGEMTLYVTVSQEKGIQFKFPVDADSERRDMFWLHLGRAAQQMRAILEEHAVPRDSEGDSEAFQWFDFADGVQANAGMRGAMVRFGGLHTG